MLKFKERIKKLRSDNNLTQKQLAKILNVNEFSVQRYEYGTRPSLDTLIALADYFNVSLDYLVGRTDKPEINK
ncbi:MAG: helix-turn-helix domain-containing protein [Oscillospiraceae bacterium]|nr:helix-turn-helix domain-containing protein [Oscillospiraceae bacterium]